MFEYMERTYHTTATQDFLQGYLILNMILIGISLVLSLGIGIGAYYLNQDMTQVPAQVLDTRITDEGGFQTQVRAQLADGTLLHRQVRSVDARSVGQTVTLDYRPNADPENQLQDTLSTGAATLLFKITGWWLLIAGALALPLLIVAETQERQREQQVNSNYA